MTLTHPLVEKVKAACRAFGWRLAPGKTWEHCPAGGALGALPCCPASVIAVADGLPLGDGKSIASLLAVVRRRHGEEAARDLYSLMLGFDSVVSRTDEYAAAGRELRAWADAGQPEETQ